MQKLMGKNMHHQINAPNKTVLEFIEVFPWSIRTIILLDFNLVCTI